MEFNHVYGAGCRLLEEQSVEINCGPHFGPVQVVDGVSNSGLNVYQLVACLLTTARETHGIFSKGIHSFTKVFRTVVPIFWFSDRWCRPLADFWCDRAPTWTNE